MSIVYDYDGIPLCHQKITPGNTITGLSSYCYKYQVYRLNFDDADSEITVGDWIVGVGSGAIGKVVYITSTAWTNGVGYLLYDSWNGTAWTDDEEIQVGAGATMADVNQPAAVVEATDSEYGLASRIQYKHLLARCALVIVYDATATDAILMGITGGKPDQTALIGTPLVASSSIKLKDHNEISSFKCVDYTSGMNSVVQVDFFF